MRKIPRCRVVAPGHRAAIADRRPEDSISEIAMPAVTEQARQRGCGACLPRRTSARGFTGPAGSGVDRPGAARGRKGA
jgi:hypothetical protein